MMTGVNAGSDETETIQQAETGQPEPESSMDVEKHWHPKKNEKIAEDSDLKVEIVRNL